MLTNGPSPRPSTSLLGRVAQGRRPTLARYAPGRRSRRLSDGRLDDRELIEALERARASQADLETIVARLERRLDGTWPRRRGGQASVRSARHDPFVPRISAFYGIVIEYFGDHPPPHFHARYGGDVALIVIATGDVFAGSLPPRALRLVREWVEERRAELELDWQRAQAHEPLEWIAPLS